MSEQAKPFEAWGIVELMGHQRVAGRLSEQHIGGDNLLRVDVPIVGANPDGTPVDTFRTVYYGSSAIYALHVTDEAAARLAAKQQGSRPSYAWELESAARLPVPQRRDDFSDNDRDERPL